MFFSRQEMNEEPIVEEYNGVEMEPVSAMQTGPIMEPPMERVIQRDIVHEVNHVCPILTKIVNNHIYKHNYVPNYCCIEENRITNIDCGSCCNFMR